MANGLTHLKQQKQTREFALLSIPVSSIDWQ